MPASLAAGLPDAVIVGGGIVGTACAEALSRQGWRVVVLERLGLAAGTSGACQGGIGIGLLTDQYDLQMHLAAMASYRDAVADGLDVDYCRSGGLVVCQPDLLDQIQPRALELQKAGVDCEWLDGAALHDAEPALSPEFVGGALLPGVAHLSPIRVTVAMAQRACQRGAQIRTNTVLTGVEMTAGRVTAALAGDERIPTERIVIAAGVWSAEVGRLAGLRIPVWPLKGNVLVTEPMPGLLHHYVTDARFEAAVGATSKIEVGPEGPRGVAPRVGTVLHDQPHGQILIGASREFAGYDREVSRERLAQIGRRACELVPALARVRVIRTYAGLRPWAPDGHPLIGPTHQAEGMVLATGHSGDGNTLALLTGSIVADLLAGRTPSIDPGPLSPDRFAMN